MAKNRHDKLMTHIESVAKIIAECEAETRAAEFARDAALAEVAARPIPSDMGGDPIDARNLADILDYDKKTGYYMASFGRLWFGVASDGEWFAETDATYGGTVHSYRKLRTMAEVRTLMELFGVANYATLKAHGVRGMNDGRIETNL